MSGHSKWATIKRKKAAIDSKRGAAFTKLLREVQVAARLGGPNLEGNPRLKSAVLAARAVSVPGDNIDRAIKRGTGTLEGQQFEEIVYEGYGPGGVALLIKSLTDNKTRTVAEVRFALGKGGGTLGGANSVAFQFQECGILQVPKSVGSEEQVMEVAIEGGAEDVRDEGDVWEVQCAAKDFAAVRTALEKLTPEVQGSIRPVPNTTVKISGEDAKNMLKLLDLLDDIDDVQSVVSNFEMDEKELEALAE